MHRILGVLVALLLSAALAHADGLSGPGSGGGGGGGGSGASVFAGTSDWVPVLNSATGTGTDNHAALQAAFTACNKNGATDLYIPPGKYYNATTIQFGTCDTSVKFAAGASVVCPPTVTCFVTYAGDPVQVPLAGIIEGYRSSMGNGWVPGNGGSGCEVGDLLKLRQDEDSYKRNRRMGVVFKVATCTGAAVATLDTIYPGNYLQTPGTGGNKIFQTISGTTTGVFTNNLTWTAPPQLGQTQRTELTLPGTNAVTEGTSCVVLDAPYSITLCQGDVIKIISRQEAPWDFSATEQQVHVVQDTGDWSYGPVVAAGGTGYTVGDVLTLLTLTSPIARGALGMGAQTLSTTPATVTVASVTATGAITGLTVTTTGTYDHVNYMPIPLTGGTGSGAQAFFTYNVTTPFVSVNYADMATVGQVIDATHIMLNRLTLFPHVYDAVHPPILIKMPKQKLVLDNITCQASGQTHNVAYTARVPSCIDLFGATYPKVSVRCINAWSICAEEMSVWMGDFDITMEDSLDMLTQGGTGYGFSSAGGSAGSSVKAICNDTRHCIAGGTFFYNYDMLPNFWFYMGGSQDVLVHDSVSSGHHVAAFNTHQDAYNWTFTNNVAQPGLADWHNTSGVISSGFDIRSYNVTLKGNRSVGNQWCIADASQVPDYSGIFPTPSLATITDQTCDGMGYQVGGNAGYGIIVTGDVVSGTPTNTHDQNAVTVVRDSTFSNVASVINVGAGSSRYAFENIRADNINYFSISNGPADFSLINSHIDNSATFHAPSDQVGGQPYMFVRGAATQLTGNANYNILNNVFEQTTVSQIGFYPLTFIRDASVNSLDTILLTMEDNKILNAGFSTALSSTGSAIITVRSAAYDPTIGRAYKKLTAVGVSMAATGDAAIIPVPPSITKYSIVEAEVSGCSASVATGLAGVWAGAAKTGTNWAANQALTGATSTITRQVLTLTAAALTTDNLTASAPNIYFNIGTAVASPTCNVLVVLLDSSNK